MVEEANETNFVAFMYLFAWSICFAFARYRRSTSHRRSFLRSTSFSYFSVFSSHFYIFSPSGRINNAKMPSYLYQGRSWTSEHFQLYSVLSRRSKWLYSLYTELWRTLTLKISGVMESLAWDLTRNNLRFELSLRAHRTCCLTLLPNVLGLRIVALEAHLAQALWHVCLPAWHFSRVSPQDSFYRVSKVFFRSRLMALSL